MSSADFVQEGAAVDYTPTEDLVAGSVVVQGELVGFTKHDIKANTLGSIAVEGVFDVAGNYQRTSTVSRMGGMPCSPARYGRNPQEPEVLLDQSQSSSSFSRARSIAETKPGSDLQGLEERRRERRRCVVAGDGSIGTRTLDAIRSRSNTQSTRDS